MGYYEQAIEKLNLVKADKLKDLKAKAVCESVRNALKTFCEQNEEFAQSVVQGGDFEQCLSSALRGVGNSIPDPVLFERAADFYFHGAKIVLEMKINLGDGGFSDNAGKKDETSLSLDSLFDF